MVAITEIVEYLVPVEANDEELAARIGEERIQTGADRDRYCVGIQARECDGCNEVAEFEVLEPCTAAARDDLVRNVAGIDLYALAHMTPDALRETIMEYRSAAGKILDAEAIA
jgi:hypothetical protein